MKSRLKLYFTSVATLAAMDIASVLVLDWHGISGFELMTGAFIATWLCEGESA